ncbi:MAG TPA: hypothetical protein PKD00_08690 [Burkholderiales bacterium]|nr:hypothetical protein [Burkholderiales bacterium]
METKNTLELSGQIVKVYPTKKTPFGLLVMSFILEHNSIIEEAGQSRQVKCRIYCIMVDSNFKEAELNNKNVVVHGFLSQNAKMQLVLHINKLNIFG